MDSGMKMYNSLYALGADVEFGAGDWVNIRIVDVQIRDVLLEKAETFLEKAGYHIQSVEYGNGRAYIRAIY